jgi:hypothetical protein
MILSTWFTSVRQRAGHLDVPTASGWFIACPLPEAISKGGEAEIPRSRENSSKAGEIFLVPIRAWGQPGLGIEIEFNMSYFIL